jgi:hypothetical protein
MPFPGQLTDDLCCVGHVEGLLVDKLRDVRVLEDSPKHDSHPSTTLYPIRE